MSQVTGVVEKIYHNERNPKCAIVVDGAKYSDYDGSKCAGIGEGDMVEFNMKQNGQYKNVASKVKKVAHTGGSAPTASTISAPASAGKLPVGIARERAIIRQNALTNAVAYSSPEASPEDVISVAREFENYTSGDDLDQAMNELEGQ